MAVSEKQRHELMKAMEGALGPEPAETLMNLLPPVGWADVATKSDLEHLRAATRADIDGFRVEMSSEFAAVRSEVLVLGIRVDERFAQVDERFARADERLGRVAAEIRADLERGLRQQLVTFLSANAVMLGIAVTLARQFG